MTDHAASPRQGKDLPGPATPYCGRFAPSPTGPLHAGSIVAALASWLDARAHDGRWLVRIEDTDTPRCAPGMADTILGQLAALQMSSDDKPLWQSRRGAQYEAALAALIEQLDVYPCGCSRRDVELSVAVAGLPRPRHADLVYPGTCRPERGGLADREPRAWRVRTDRRPDRARAADSAPGIEDDRITIDWVDRRLGPQSQQITRDVGDFVLRRADGLWAYQLAVVVDDAAQGITSIVRGQDLADNTARQIHLQSLLHYPRPAYLHTPLVHGENGEKLSKQNGATAIDTTTALAASRTLREAGRMLGLELQGQTPGDMLASGVASWTALYKLA